MWCSVLKTAVLTLPTPSAEVASMLHAIDHANATVAAAAAAATAAAGGPAAGASASGKRHVDVVHASDGAALDQVPDTAQDACLCSTTDSATTAACTVKPLAAASSQADEVT